MPNISEKQKKDNIKVYRMIKILEYNILPDSFFIKKFILQS